MNKSIYYNLHDIQTYNRLHNMIVGVRGHGKTYQCSKKCIDVGLQQKRISFVVLVRYKEDILAIKDDWWSLVEHLYEGWTFSSKKNIIYASNGLETFPIGEFVALNQYMRAKRKPRPYVKVIFFDECLNEENDYLPNEINAYNSIVDTITRNRNDVRCYLVSNTITILNPYFNYFGFNQLGKRFTRGLHDSVLEFTDSEQFVEFRKTTKFGSSIMGTEYGNFALLGHMMLDDTSNVSKVPNGQCKHQFNISLEGELLEVCMVVNIMYIRKSNDYMATSFTPYVDDAVKNGAIYCPKKLTHFDFIADNFLRDTIMYETLDIKNKVINFMKFKMGNN